MFGNTVYNLEILYMFSKPSAVSCELPNRQEKSLNTAGELAI